MMTEINWKHCIGQRHIKKNLEAALANGTLGHTYLFSGAAGTGKFAAALDLSLALLCESTDSRPCLTCESCTKVLHYAHPDFHMVMPVVLSEKHKKENEITAEGWVYISECVKERISTPYAMPGHVKVPDIPLDWIRELGHAVLRGPSNKNTNVAVIDGVDRMKASTANAMLKLLEEPPAGTVLLLLTDRPSAVLPTIVSRCQIMRFSYSPPDDIRRGLCSRFSIDPSDPRLDTVIHTGSFGRSLRQWEHPSDEARESAGALWDLCLREDWPELSAYIDRLSEQGDYSAYEQLFTELMRRIRNAFLRELNGTENLFLSDRSSIVDLQGTTSLAKVERLSKLCEYSIAGVKARANMTLVLTHFAIALTELLHGKKQQYR